MGCGRNGRWLLAAGLGLLLASGCQIRPKFKVDVSDIDKSTTSLLVNLWLANIPPDTSNGYIDVVPENLPSGFTQFSVPDCGSADKNCNPNRREYSFGINFTQDPNLVRHTALVGVAATDAAGCLRSVLTGEISDPAELGDPETLPLSLQDGPVETSNGRCAQAPLVITEAISEFDARVSGAQPVLLIVVNGWGFRPDAILEVNDGCGTSQIRQNTVQPGQPLPLTMANIISVTPTQIIAQVGSANLLRSKCLSGVIGEKTITVINSPDANPSRSSDFKFVVPASSV